MFQIKLQTVFKVADFSIFLASLKRLNVLVEISLVKMAEIFCFTGTGEVENGKKPDDFISSSLKPYGQCGLKGPFWCDVCYLIWVDPPETTQLMLITYQPELQTNNYKKERKKQNKIKTNSYLCIYTERLVITKSWNLTDVCMMGPRGSVKFRRLCEAISSLFFNKSGSILASLLNWFWKIFAKSSLSKAEKAMKGFILSRVFFWAFVHF